MKKLTVILLIIMMFMLGLVLGDGSYYKNKVIEDGLKEYENAIKEENNTYEPFLLKPEKNLLDKVAFSIDNIINKVFNKIKRD